MPDPKIDSPPLTERTAGDAASDAGAARDRLNRLADALAQSRDAQLLRDFLRLRAAVRS